MVNQEIPQVTPKKILPKQDLLFIIKMKITIIDKSARQHKELFQRHCRLLQTSYRL